MAENNHFYNLFNLNESLTNLSMRHWNKTFGEDVSLTQLIVLNELQTFGRMTQNELAEKMVISKGAVSQIIKNLENKELVTREVEETDRRNRFLVIEEKGLETISRAEKHAEALREEYMDLIPEEELTNYLNTQRKFTDYLKSHI
ncbi:MarR family winged helix-turn-helix transcriptional regulator [Salinicoccus halodurans]|uniref:DNA-binding transcriptional regulator, MarR family n=1 Tax=Salinicoccus halodurans TaxID=407035 RepID=A0A0F7HP14_9STAP|nr:MarR family transcriptional regulator [Salinicoccus halodurans]AKG74844.1 hypothetical protein AAT16_11975 [Salinicoccus halodurans]SFK69538.1 DNA-binding transcriptional regulator, MarR family [Salinicoccus halodurans]